MKNDFIIAIAQLSAEKNLDSNKAFDEAVKKAVREQAQKKGLEFQN